MENRKLWQSEQPKKFCRFLEHLNKLFMTSLKNAAHLQELQFWIHGSPGSWQWQQEGLLHQESWWLLDPMKWFPDRGTCSKIRRNARMPKRLCLTGNSYSLAYRLYIILQSVVEISRVDDQLFNCIWIRLRLPTSFHQSVHSARLCSSDKTFQFSSRKVLGSLRQIVQVYLGVHFVVLTHSSCVNA